MYQCAKTTFYNDWIWSFRIAIIETTSRKFREREKFFLIELMI